MNIKELNLKQLETIFFDYFPEKSREELYNIPLEELEILLNSEEEDIEEPFDPYLKHLPSRKKKANRVGKKGKKKIQYKKQKNPKSQEKTVKNNVYKLHADVDDDETNNRQYLQKLSKSHINLKRSVNNR